MKALAPQTTVRPWLQAFRWRTKSYNDDYILEQVRGALEAGAKGYLFWNASNSYDPVHAAMRRLATKSANSRKRTQTVIVKDSDFYRHTWASGTRGR